MPTHGCAAHGLVNPVPEPMPLPASQQAVQQATQPSASPEVALTAAQLEGLKAQVSQMLTSSDPEALLAAARKALASQAGQAGIKSPLAKKFEAIAESLMHKAASQEEGAEPLATPSEAEVDQTESVEQPARKRPPVTEGLFDVGAS